MAATPPAQPPISAVKTFDDVFAAEISYIRARRESVAGHALPTTGTPTVEPVGESLIGLAMSGGGIRSAIFNLGVLQAFHRSDVFPHIDYISTVSGGGYIGTCLTVLMRKPQSQFPFAADSKILRWLRDRSQYLGTRGLWVRAGSILLLGLLINLVTLSPVLLLASFVIALYGRFRLTDLLPPLEQPTFDPLFLLCALFVLLAIRSAFESLLRAILWPLILQVELSIKNAPELGPKEKRRAQRFAVIFEYSVAILNLIPGMKLIGRTLGQLASVPKAWLEEDWSLVGKKSLEARQIFRRDLERFVMALTLFAVLEIQPVLLRFVHAPPPITEGAFSIELWTAIISLVAALASVFSVGGSRARGLTLTRVAPYVAAVSGPLGLYLLCLLIAERLLFKVPRELWTLEYWLALLNPAAWSVDQVVPFLGASLVIVAAYFLLPWFFFDLNDRSIHGFYRDSLSETFVVTESAQGTIEPEGDLRLSELNQIGSSAPYQLLNATLNLQADPALRNTGRNGDFFLLTRDVVGGDRTGYAPTSDLELRYGAFNVASAMATSGAAASPHMGIFSRRPFVFIMSLFNIRLGCWLPNPGNPRRGPSGQPGFWRPNPFWLFHELFGQLHAKGGGIYVSDGGHLENTGVYQLLKRRCRVIFAVDAGTDSKMQFQSLADLKRYARIDLGVEIKIDLEPLQLNEKGLTRAHWVAGAIHYPATGTQPPCQGQIFLIKSSLTGDEDAEIHAYKAQWPDFPHEPLTDQFFEEAQFEAYRLLGLHAAEELMRENSRNSVSHSPGGSPSPQLTEDQIFSSISIVC